MSMAIKYHMQKKAKNMANGGSCDEHGLQMCEMCHGGKMAEGGFVEEEKASGYDRGDMVDAIMKKRMAKGGEAGSYPATWVGNPKKPDAKEMDGEEMLYSKGGMVANDVGEGQEADKLPNQFDDLVLRDDMEEHYTGANSGDEIGDKQEDEDRRDMVAMIMKSRKKKDRLPSPL